MRCSICKIEGHKANNKNFHSVNKISKENNFNVKVELVENKQITSNNLKQETNLEISDAKYNIDFIVQNLYEYITSQKNERIMLLRKKEVIQWLFGDLTFLPPIEKKNKKSDELKNKILEDKWGQDILKIRRPDLKLDKQWTNKFGEHLCEEIFTLLNKEIAKPKKQQHYQPDYEINDSIIEAKAGTYYTSGTAGEKILGCPFKYAEIPDLYNKQLKILCIGGAEKVCREQYGNLPGAKCSKQKKRFLDFFKENKIEYIGATDILKSLINL